MAAIGLLDAPTIVLPTGGSGGGFVAPLYAGYYHSVSVEGEQLDIAETAIVTPMGNWGWQYLFVNAEPAEALAKQIEKYATAVHAVFCKNADVLNRTEAIETKFGDVICGTVRQVTTQSKKYRHQYQMIGLPSLVHAAARMFGYEVPEIDFGELSQQDSVLRIDRDDLSPEQIAEIEAQFIKLCGDKDAKNGQPGYYQQSAYWRQRATIWAALGEQDARACHRKEAGDKFSTKSDALDACFQVALANWTQPLWGRMRLMNDPSSDEKAVFSTSGKRGSIGVITDLWSSEAEARESAGGSDENTTTLQSAPAGPVVPADYVSAGFDANSFGEEIKRTSGKAVPLAAKEMGVDASVVAEWREHLGL